MNGTKLTRRQIKILDILSETPITGVKILEKIKNDFSISKATLMRELDFLKRKKFIKIALQKIVDMINKINFPLTKALLISIMIAYLQPFVDGKGQVGLYLMPF